MPAVAQALQHCHHQGARKVHGSDCGRYGTHRPSVHPVLEGADAGAGDVFAAGLPAGQAGEGEAEGLEGAERSEAPVRRAEFRAASYRQSRYVRY